MKHNKYILLNQQVEKDNVTGGNWNKEVEIRSVTSEEIWINKWIGTAQKVRELNGT